MEKMSRRKTDFLAHPAHSPRTPLPYNDFGGLPPGGSQNFSNSRQP